MAGGVGLTMDKMDENLLIAKAHNLISAKFNDLQGKALSDSSYAANIGSIFASRSFEAISRLLHDLFAKDDQDPVAVGDPNYAIEETFLLDTSVIKVGDYKIGAHLITIYIDRDSDIDNPESWFLRFSISRNEG